MKLNKAAINRIAVCLASILLFSLYPPASHASEAEDAVARIQKAYENIRDLSGDFIQKGRIKELKRTDTYRGNFYIKAARMKWDYSGDNPQTVYVNGNSIVIYQKKEKQAFRSRFDGNSYGQAPLALLAGFGSINKEFEVSMKGGGRRLVLKPKKPMGNISYLELLPSEGEFPIDALTIVDAFSNRIDIKFYAVKINSGLGDGLFEFSPPAGVKVFQQ